jgi:hypothetical protein
VTTTQAKEAKMSTLNEHASAVDTRIAETYLAATKAEAMQGAERRSARRAAGQREQQYGRHDVRWVATVASEQTFVDFDHALARLAAKGDERIMSYGCTGNEMLARLAAADKAVTDTWAAYQAAEADYDGWSRFFMVAGGHIHSSMNCGTCNHNGSQTRFGWLPELSGLTETEAVAAHGPVLCTVCFPSAPVEWTAGSLNASGEYVAPKPVCPGSNTSDVEGEIPPARGYSRTRYARCSHCHEVVAYTGKGLRKHAPAKAAK